MTDGTRGLAIAVITGAHGVRGGLRVKLHRAGSDAIQPGVMIELWRGERRLQCCTVDRFSPIPGSDRARLFVSEIDDRDRADALRGAEIVVERAELPALGPDEFYLADVLGHEVERVRENGTSQALGRVIGLSSNGAQDLLDIEWRTGDGGAHRWLLPVLPQFIIEVGEARIVVDVPSGLLPDPLEGA